MALNVNPDVLRCARTVFQDLFVRWLAVPPTFRDLCDLCALHGGAPLIDPAMIRRPAKCHDGEIILSPYCTLSQYREIIPHELVHRLADTPRWAWLNDTLQDWRYDRTQFIEAVARLVGQMFRQMLITEPQY